MITAGTVAPERTVGPVTVSDFVRYAGASGDFNPMHFDVARAEEAGFEAPFAQGMFSAGLLASFAADWLGPENLRAIRVRFLEIVRLGDTLTCSGRVTSGDKSVVEVELTGRRQTGAVAVRGSATFLLP